jgi:Apea-like HEPN/ApeA N-terminal domain 1
MGNHNRERTNLSIWLLCARKQKWHFAGHFILCAVAVCSNRIWLNTDELEFETLLVSYSHLHDWVRKSALHISSFDPEKESTVSLDKSHLITSAEVGSYVISIGIGVNASFSGSPPAAADLRQDTYFQVKQKEGELISFPELLRLQSRINNFLSLTSNMPFFPLTIDALAPVDGERPAQTRVLFEPVRTSPKKASSAKQMLFTYDSVANVFQDSLARVIEDENMQTLYTQFFAEFHNPSTFVENRFMAVIRAIEVFHRRVFEKSYYVPEAEYKGGLRKDLEKVVNSADIETNFRKSLIKKLEYGYQYSLRTRLKELLNEYGSEFLSLFVDKKKSVFIGDVVSTRNWLTHFDENDRKAAVTDNEELAYLSGRLEILLTILLLNYIGISKDDIAEAIRRHSESSFMKFGWLRPNDAL